MSRPNTHYTIDQLFSSFRIENEVLEKYIRKIKKWTIVSTRTDRDGYIRTRFGYRKVYYHRLVWEISNNRLIPEGLYIDHIDGNILNNKANNLRLANNRLNQINRKKNREGRLCGCTYLKSSNRWLAKIMVNKKLIKLGIYDTELEGHMAYMKAFNELGEIL